MTPPTTPTIIDSTVTSSVPFRKPLITGCWFIAWKTKCQSNALLVTNRCTSMATSTAITAIATQRPGCRTGTASIAPGRSAAEAAGRVSVSVLMFHSRVDGEVGDRARVVVPLRQCRFVGALGVQGLQRLGDRLRERGLRLRDHITVRRGVVDLTELLELAVGLLERVQHDGGVGQHRVGLAADQVRGRLVLLLPDHELDLRFPVGLALGLPLRDVVLELRRTLLHRDGLAARVVGVDALRVALRGRPQGAGIEVADHVDLLLALVVDGERRDADVVLAALDTGDDGVETGRLPLDRDTELLRHRVEQVDVHADHGLAALQKLVRRVAGVDASAARGLAAWQNLVGGVAGVAPAPVFPGRFVLGGHPAPRARPAVRRRTRGSARGSTRRRAGRATFEGVRTTTRRGENQNAG